MGHVLNYIWAWNRFCACTCADQGSEKVKAFVVEPHILAAGSTTYLLHVCAVLTVCAASVS